MAALLVVRMADSMDLMSVVHWVELRAVLSAMMRVDRMDACSAARLAAHLVASLVVQWVARSVESLVAWKDTSSATVQGVIRKSERICMFEYLGK